MDKAWNHNIHYHAVLADAVPHHAEWVLDVGCGEGMFARELHRRGLNVVGIDLDEASIALARQAAPRSIQYITGDFLEHPFEPESFDAVFAVATLHHMDATAGLQRMKALVRPGGTVGVIGLARDEGLVDFGKSVLGFFVSRAYRIQRQFWAHPSPQVWPPPETWTSLRNIVQRELPGCHFRRHLLWRCSILWTKPQA